MIDGSMWEGGRLVIPGVAAFAAGVGATWGVRGLARRLGIVNKPNPLVPQHTKPIAYLGGVGLGIGAACGMLAMTLSSRGGMDGIGVPPLTIAVPAVLFLVLGAVDDLVAFEPSRKFLLQSVIAGLAVALGLWSPLTGIELVDRVLAWFWIVTLVNAFNVTDVCDGLLGSLSAVMFGFIGLAYPALAPVCIVLLASCCGFLVFNKPPATIFLGDAGSHLLGALAAALTIAGARVSQVDSVSHLLAAVLLVGVPLFELAFLVVVRTRKGLAWWRGSPDHFSLRMQAGGLSRLRTDLIACLVAAALGAAAFGVHRIGVAWQGAIAVLVVVLAVVAARVLLRWEVKRTVLPGLATSTAGSSDQHSA